MLETADSEAVAAFTLCGGGESPTNGDDPGGLGGAARCHPPFGESLVWCTSSSLRAAPLAGVREGMDAGTRHQLGNVSVPNQ